VEAAEALPPNAVVAAAAPEQDAQAAAEAELPQTEAWAGRPSAGEVGRRAWHPAPGGLAAAASELRHESLAGSTTRTEGRRAEGARPAVVPVASERPSPRSAETHAHPSRASTEVDACLSRASAGARPSLARDLEGEEAVAEQPSYCSTAAQRRPEA